MPEKIQKEKLKPCPFCGAEAEVVVYSTKFRIVGCNVLSMLCPNPKMVVYPDNDGSYDYKYWNNRV